MVYTSVVNLLGSGKTNNFLMWTRSYRRKPVHKCYRGSVKECNLSKTSVSSGSVWLKMVLILFPGKAGGIMNVWVVESIYPILHWNLLKQSVCRVSIHKTQNIAKLIQLIYQPSNIYPHTSNNEESSESRAKLKHNLNISFKVNGLLLNSQNHDFFFKNKNI